jgi:hypothetical protein
MVLMSFGSDNIGIVSRENVREKKRSNFQMNKNMAAESQMCNV